jgi:hypothetical protein
MPSSALSVAAAVIVALLGVLSLLAVVSGPDDDGADAAPIQTTVTQASVSSSQPVAEPEVVTMTESAPDIAELSPAIANLLHARGFAEATPGSELERDLPETVVQVLIDRGVVLTVATDAEEGGTP